MIILCERGLEHDRKRGGPIFLGGGSDGMPEFPRRHVPTPCRACPVRQGKRSEPDAGQRGYLDGCLLGSTSEGQHLAALPKFIKIVSP
jgi:hypothetical protein